MPTIAVYAGHGGSESGAVSNGLREKDLTLQISNALTRILRDRGYKVINNRTTDVDRSISADARLANANNVDAVIEIHLNSNSGNPGSGTETYYSVTGKGKTLAEAINKNIAALGYVDRGVKTLTNVFGEDYLGIIRLTNAPAVLVEAFFINNPSEIAKYDPIAIATAIANGISEIYPINKPAQNANVIKYIQSTLMNRYGYALSVDGIAGARTKKALIAALQTELNRQFGAGLNVDGIFGAKTKAALPTVKLGAKGNITFLIQAALYIKGYGTYPDGIYGAGTENAIKSFQRDNGLTADGIAGKNTLSALFTF